VTETEWLDSSDPAPMLRYLRERQTSERKLRLLACACCRRIWHLLPDPRSQRAVEVAECFADHRASKRDLAFARTNALGAADSRAAGGASWGAYWAVNSHASGPSLNNVLAATSVILPQASKRCEADYSADLARESSRQVGLIHEVFGNPFRPARVDDYVLAWDGGLVRQLAEGIYEDRAFDRMPVLGDALEDAGCTSAAVLEHCRDRGEHVRGCWVLDLILGFE
jgi:hypothetical protein